MEQILICPTLIFPISILNLTTSAARMAASVF